MIVPRFWAHCDGTVWEPDGQEIALRCWGCSPTSAADAEVDARRRFQAQESRFASGRPSELDPRTYTYGRSLLREELIEEIPGSRGATVAIRTRNRYGAEVLNAANALFLDVDLPADSLMGRIGALLRGRSTSLQVRTLERLRGALERAAQGSYRIYRTAAGFRVLATDRMHEPGSDAAIELMRAAGTDPAFITLCGVQQCFRARLSPKPWRIGQPRPPTSFPYASQADEARMRRWQAEYLKASEGWAVCRFVETVGPRQVHPDIARLVDLHDRSTRATADLPLA